MIEVAGDSGTVVRTLSEHKDAITDIASGTFEEQTVVASADMAGAIYVRAQDGSPLAQITSPAGYFTLSPIRSTMSIPPRFELHVSPHRELFCVLAYFFCRLPRTY